MPDVADLAGRGSGDNATAVGLYSAIVTALYRRERTGKDRMSRPRSSLKELVSKRIDSAACAGEIFRAHTERIRKCGA